MNKPNNVVRIPSSLEGDFFKYWLAFLSPLHDLTDRESEIAACFIKHRYLLGKVIKDDSLIDKILMSEDERKKIKEECNITQPHFQVILGKLKKSRVIVDGKLNPKFIPKIGEDNYFQLLLYFDFNEGESNTNSGK